jgi:sensor histidine kinase YesM
VHKIPLAEEVSLLRYYVSLEMLRFENKFEVIYDLDPAIDLRSIQVPSMLIQPYVENAILHGLYNKQEKGLLRISLRGQDDALLFQVEDNGVGRAEAARIGRQTMQRHKSIGMMLTQERLAIINQRYNVTVSIEDLSDQYGPAGTRVNIFVKI